MVGTEAQSSALIGGRWRLERLIGQGGMSDVYRAVDEPGGGAVALKIVRSSDPELARRLAKEAKALAGFDHPGLVRMFDSGIHHDQAFLVMELIDGSTLASRLRSGPLSPQHTALLATGIGSALAYVHARGIVHRDLKPANVLLGPRMRVRLADFGIAKVLDASSITVTGATLGTPAYMAPEQIADHAVGTSADIWSLGLILLECLLGRKVFEGTPAEVVARRLASPVVVPTELPTSWRLLLGAMLDEDPARRPSATDVAGMVSAPAFEAPWRPPPPAIAGSAGPSNLTLVDARSASPESPKQATLPQRPDETIRAPAALHMPRRRAGRRIWAVTALVAVSLAAALTGWALSGSRVAARTPPRHPPAASTTTTTSSTTTTTSVPGVGDAAATLTRDVESGIADGSIRAGAGTNILNKLDSVLAASDASAPGPANSVSSALGDLDSSIANGESSGAITAGEASTLTADVAAIANALGAPTVATTAPTPTTAPAPGPATTRPAKGGGGGGDR